MKGKRCKMAKRFIGKEQMSKKKTKTDDIRLLETDKGLNYFTKPPVLSTEHNFTLIYPVRQRENRIIYGTYITYHVLSLVSSNSVSIFN